MTSCSSNSQGSKFESEDIAISSNEQNTNNLLEQAVVKRVVDGDTVKVKINDEEYTVRLIGIDTPESVHPDSNKNTVYGKEASDYAKDIIKEGNTVYLEKDISDTDMYGRLLRYLWLDNTDNTEDENEIKEKMYNAKIIKEGYAVAYKFGKDKKNYEFFYNLELEAAENNIGLWSENGLVSKNKKSPYYKENSFVKEDKKEEDTTNYKYIGNKNTKKFHLPSCSYVPKKENTVYFKTKEDALEKDFKPCSICNP